MKNYQSKLQEQGHAQVYDCCNLLKRIFDPEEHKVKSKSIG